MHHIKHSDEQAIKKAILQVYLKAARVIPE